MSRIGAVFSPVGLNGGQWKKGVNGVGKEGLAGGVGHLPGLGCCTGFHINLSMSKGAGLGLCIWTIAFTGLVIKYLITVI